MLLGRFGTRTPGGGVPHPMVYAKRVSDTSWDKAASYSLYERESHTFAPAWYCLRFATAGNCLRQGKRGPAREEGQLPRRQLAHDTEVAEIHPCIGKASLFLAFLAPK